MEMGVSETHKQYLAAIISTGVSFAGGLGFGWTSPVESQIVEDDLGECSRSLCVSKTEFAWIASSMAIGSLSFGFLAGPVMSRIGRKPALISYCLVSIIGWLMLTFATFKWMLFAGRFLAGAGFGGSGVIVPVYISEIAQTSIRGRLASMFEASIQSGIMLTYFLGYLFSMLHQTAISTGIIMLMGVALFFIPESPRYYISQDKFEKAKKALQWLRGNRFNKEKEILEIVDFQNVQENKGYRTLLSEKVNRKALMISMVLVSGYELSGINGVLFYTASIFEEANIDIEPNLAAVFIGLFSITGTITSLLLVDKIGRRKILLTAYSIMFVCFTIMGIYFQLQTHNPAMVKGLGMLPVVTLCIYCFFNAAEAPVTFVLMGELFAQNVKDVAASASMTCDYSFSIAVSVVFPLLADTTGFGSAFFFFSTFNALLFVFVACTVPETKEKSFKEIQNMLLTGKKK